MTYVKVILIFVIGIIIVLLLSPIIEDYIMLALFILFIITSFALIKAVSYEGRLPKKRWKKIMLKNKTPQRFEQIYEYIKNNYTYELEQLRKKLVKHLSVAGIILAIFLVITIKVWLEIKHDIAKYVMILPILYMAYVYKKYNTKYQSKYKKYVIENFVQTMYHTLTYENINNKRLEKFYEDAQFENVNYTYCQSEDYISGEINGTWIEISDIILKLKSNKGGEHTEFKCIFSYSQISKMIPHQIKIRNNKNRSKIENNKVELDNEEFEKYFDVFTDSRILAMEILTHDIMEDMIQFYNNSEIDFEIVIKENRIYIRYEVGDIFEGKIFKESTNKASLWICYSTLMFAINLTSKINKILQEKEV